MDFDLPEYDWRELESIAREVVQECMDALPEELRALADQVPCIMRRWHPDVAAGDESKIDMLGEYLPQDDGSLRAPHGVIALYLGGIALYCEDEELYFDDEVETTFLHELGHHFGWNEEDVAERGL